MFDTTELKALCAENGCSFAENELMSAHTTFRIGGACAALVTPESVPACETIFAYLRKKNIPYALIGRGSNLLVRDEGYPGVVLKLGGALAEELSFQPQPDGRTLVTCGAGVSLKNLCMAALAHSLTGLEFAYGIPGSVGGAVYMNAGAYNGEMSQVVRAVEILDEDGKIEKLPAGKLDFSYRHSVFMGRRACILRAEFLLETGRDEDIRAKMQELLERRKSKQPLEFPSAGSTFKRPKTEGYYASRMIDEAGLRGYTSGGAQVSEKHAGFVINRGGATFADVMAVCRHVQEVVREQTGILLEMEPEILG